MEILNEFSNFFRLYGVDPLVGGFICGILVCAFAKVSLFGKVKDKKIFLNNQNRNQNSRPEPLISFDHSFGSSMKILSKINGQEKELADSELAEVMNAIRKGNKIEAIKLLRELTGFGLKEAKDVVEVIEKSKVVSTSLLS